MSKTGRKMQDVSFRDVDDFLEYIPENELKVVELLRDLCNECLPQSREKLSYNVPFYSLNKRIAYIWPGSVKWGNVTFEGVQFGLCQGHLIADDLRYFEKQGRKQIITRKFFTPADVDLDLMRHYLFEAYAIDQSFQKHSH